MQNELLPEQLKFEKATIEDRNEITNLLKEANLLDYTPENENYKSFYLVKLNKKIICCFALDTNTNIALLKSFGVRKELRGKGIGKIIANKLSELGKSLGLKKIYAASWEAPNFWKKAGFKEINYLDSKDNHFLNYAHYLEEHFPQFTKDRKYFVLDIG